MRLEWLKARPIANRGLHNLKKHIWENTLPAFELAALSNFTICCDVQLSHNGVPMIFHGTSLEHITHKKNRIIDLSSSAIEALRFGDGQQQIISLQTMLETIDGKVPVLVNLEGNEGLDAGLIAKATELLAHYNNKSAVMSEDIHLLRRLQFCHPSVPHGIKARGNQRIHIEQHFSMLAHNLEFVCYKHNEIANPFTRFAKQKLSLPVLAWHIDSKHDWEKAKRYADQMVFDNFIPCDQDQSKLAKTINAFS